VPSTWRLLRKSYSARIFLSASASSLQPGRLRGALKSETGLSPTDKEARRSVNEWKNELKHMDDPAGRTVVIDPAFAAEWHIEQALINFYKLEKTASVRKTASVWKFEDHQNSCRSDFGGFNGIA
jgi:hypothetical protein